MSHNVEKMAYAGETPWHGLGTRVMPNLSTDEMLKEAGLDWYVEKKHLFMDVDGQNVSVGRSALVRSSDMSVLDVVSNSWNTNQNHDAFEFFREFVETGGMEMHTAGSLQKGKLVWVLAKMSESFELFGKDKVDSYLLFTNPHKFGQAIDVRFTPIRVVCNNTLNLSLETASANMVRVNHSKKFDPALVKTTMGLALEKMDSYKEAAEFLASKRFTEETLSEFFSRVFPFTGEKKSANDNPKLSRNAEIALKIMNTQPGAEFGEGSWWQAYNAVTFMTDHVLGRNSDSRLASSWYGTNKTVKLSALNSAVEFAKAA